MTKKSSEAWAEPKFHDVHDGTGHKCCAYRCRQATRVVMGPCPAVGEAPYVIAQPGDLIIKAHDDDDYPVKIVKAAEAKTFRLI